MESLPAGRQVESGISNHLIYAKGSTPARTRLYQMGMASIWDKVSMDFEVYGLRDGKWKAFKRGVNYGAFFVKRK